MTNPEFNYIDKQYRFLWSNNFLEPGNKISQELPYKIIEYEQEPNLGTAPVFKITFQRHGKIKYHGIRHVDPIGKYYSHISVNEIGKICYLIDLLKINNLNDDYSRRATCGSSYKIKITKDNNEVIEIIDYFNSGPIELWAIQKVILGLIFSIKWEIDSLE